MAKVMVSMPDELLARVDAEAARKGSTRSAVLRGFAESALESNAREAMIARRAALSDAPGLVAPRGGNVAELVKRGRLR
ncbi:MAG: ribbon-helix-helix protein, CopG family [Solirubrobacterales bacterium]